MDRVKGAEDEEEEEEEGWDVFFFGRSDEASVWKPPRSVGVGRCPVVPVEVAMSSSWIPRGSFTEQVRVPCLRSSPLFVSWCPAHGRAPVLRSPTEIVGGATSRSKSFQFKKSRANPVPLVVVAANSSFARAAGSVHGHLWALGWRIGRVRSLHCAVRSRMPTSSLLVPLPARAKNRASQYAWNAKTKTVVKLNDSTAVPSTYTYTRDVVSDLRASLHAAFFPATDQVTPDYWEYIKWRGWHRLFSSMSSIFATQSLLLAVGVGAKNTLPAAAGINWWVLTRVRDLTAALMWTRSSDKRRRRRSDLLTTHYSRSALLVLQFPGC